MEEIIFESEKYNGKLIINNPKKLNSFDFDMIKDLNKKLNKIKKSKLKTTIITGKGKAFCSGGDIHWERSVCNMPKKEAKKQISFVQNTFSKIETMPQVFIALINGYSVGGGNELSMACDIRVALPEAKFSHPENKLGTIAPLGGTKRLPRLIGLGRAKYMLFTGKTIDSKTALEWGLVDFLINKNKIKHFMNELTESISKNPISAQKLTKKSVNLDYIKDLTDSFEAESYINCSRTKRNKQVLEKFLKK